MPVLNDVVFGGAIFPSEIQVEIVLGEPSTGSDTPSIEVIEEVAGILSGMTQLTQGMSYVDVNFGAAQPTADWVLVGLSISNLADLTPLNLWPGVVTNKSTTGFRLQLNGLPDSGNYFLHWSIRGAFGYYFTGPESGIVDVASTAFSVSLPPGSSLSGSVIITPHDGGAGGTFTPATVSLTVASPSATFTYTPSTDGTVAIGVTNNRGLSDPASKTYVVSLVAATTYTFSGPSSGEVDIESTDFTVELPTDTSVPSAVTITPDDSSDGVFTPTTVELTTSAPSATFTYTPASVGAKTISVTNDGGLTNPRQLTYTSTAPFSPTDISGAKTVVESGFHRWLE